MESKTRIELMRDKGVRDDMKSEHTMFYVGDKNIHRNPTKIKTNYEIKNNKGSGQGGLYDDTI